MAEKIDKNGMEKLAEKFNVSPAECERYRKFYDEKIMPRIKKKYLSDLISVVEDLIDEKLHEKILKEIMEEAPEDMSEKEAEIKALQTKALRRYRIIVSDKLPRNDVKYHTWSLSQGAVIMYAPENSETDICAIIAHELGNLLIEHGIIHDSHTEAHANLFAHFALNME